MSSIDVFSPRVNRDAPPVRTQGACPRCGGTESMIIPVRGPRGRQAAQGERCCSRCGAHQGFVRTPPLALRPERARPGRERAR